MNVLLEQPMLTKSRVSYLVLALVMQTVANVPSPLSAQVDTAEKPAGEVRSDNGLKMKLCWCPPGKFTMGSPKDEVERGYDEDQVEVTLTQGFWLGKTEVTQGQWTEVMKTSPWKSEKYAKKGPGNAASFVTWDEAVSFCSKLTAQEHKAGRIPSGWAYRLPTEAEWEYACRAGTTTRFGFGDDDAKLGDYAWYKNNASDKNAKNVREEYAHGAGLKKPNVWGLHDMHGNVLEWCQDLYAQKLPGGSNPKADAEGSDRVSRGGSWTSAPERSRSALRSFASPDSRYHNLGFRVVLSQSVE